MKPTHHSHFRSLQSASGAAASLPIHVVSLPSRPYRPFFLAGIIVILTAGAAWGTWLLWQIGSMGTFTGVSIFEVNAHGHAQIFGWVVLFIMGFAYQAFPRLWNTTLAMPHLAMNVFMLMLIGIILSTLGIWGAERSSLAESSVMIGGIVQIVAAICFAGQVVMTWKRSDEPMSPAIAFILGALVWLVLMTTANLWHTLALVQADSREALLTQIATYQAALRDMQVHGLALFMILGVSMRFFPSMFGMATTRTWRGWLGFSLICIAVLAEIALLITSRLAESMAAAKMLPIAWLTLVIGVGLIVIPWRLWRPLPKLDRSTKFVRTAYAWLGVSLIMLLLLPAYMFLQEMAFSHAYYGAVRHAITVGFVSMMIMGVAVKVVPTLSGIDPKELPPLWTAFILVNVGCALRVSMQVLSDWHAIGFAVIGMSGVLEVTGLAIWGVGLAWIMIRRKPLWPMRKEREHEVVDPSALRTDLQPEMTMQQIATQHPQLRPAMRMLDLDTCCSADRTIREMAEKRGVHPVFLMRAITEQTDEAPRSVTGASSHACGCRSCGS